MKKLLLATVALAVMGVGAASAADLAARRPVYKAPPIPVAVMTWNGFYLGVNGGYSWGPWDSTSVDAIFPDGGLLDTSASPRVNGWLFGGQIGYNWQFNSNWVAGLEADGQITGERATADGTSTFLVPFNSDLHFRDTVTATNEWKFPWFATLRARLGVLVDPQTLLYATGGLALGEFKFSSQTVTVVQGLLGQTSNTPSGSPITIVGTPFSESQTRVGGAVGAGIERKFGPNWSVKAEYLYLDYGTATFFSGTGSDTSVRLRDHIFRGGINFHFAPAAVAASY